MVLKRIAPLISATYLYNTPARVSYQSGISFSIDPHLDIYGFGSEDFTLEIFILGKNDEKLFEHIFSFSNLEEEVRTDPNILGVWKKNEAGYFYIKIQFSEALPSAQKIKTVIYSFSTSEVKEQVFPIEVQKIAGEVTDFSGTPIERGAVLVFGDAFEIVSAAEVKNGHFSLLVPNRVYNAISVKYFQNKRIAKPLEAWCWNLNVKNNLDTRLKFRIGNLSFANLNVWENNGGASVLFIYFRVFLNENLLDLDLEALNAEITLGTRPLKIISIQKLYEYAGSTLGDLPAVLMQVGRPANLTEEENLLKIVMKSRDHSLKGECSYYWRKIPLGALS
ncbi:MAG: hypothetical protein ACFFCZ_23020 [Promethearchaeota archaeon]